MLIIILCLVILSVLFAMISRSVYWTVISSGYWGAVLIQDLRLPWEWGGHGSSHLKSAVLFLLIIAMILLTVYWAVFCARNGWNSSYKVYGCRGSGEVTDQLIFKVWYWMYLLFGDDFADSLLNCFFHAGNGRASWIQGLLMTREWGGCVSTHF